jgi:DNA-binding Lrp family transcriptional regulator
MNEILNLLKDNAKLSYEDIAKVLKRKPSSVKSDVNKLEKSGVILGYKAIINEGRVKDVKSVRAIVEVKVIPKRNLGFDYIAERIYKFPEVKTCYLVSGTYELLLILEGEDIHKVSQFIAEKLAPLEGVRGTVTHFFLKKYKEDGVVFESKGGNHRKNITL